MTRFCRRFTAGLFLLLGIGTLLWPGRARADSSDVYEIIRRIDQLYRSETSRARFTMAIVTPHWSRMLEMDAWSRGTDETLIRIRAPKKERGVATLRIGSEMWNYLPKTDKVIKVPPSMMMGSWMGSDFTNDDIVSEFSLFEDYTYSEVTPPEADSSLIYIRAVPRPDLPVVWAEIVMAIDRSQQLPIRDEYFDEKGALIRVMQYSELRTFSGRRLPAVMEVVPQNKEGHRTVIRYESLELDVPLDPDLFSLRSLRSTP